MLNDIKGIMGVGHYNKMFEDVPMPTADREIPILPSRAKAISEEMEQQTRVKLLETLTSNSELIWCLRHKIESLQECECCRALSHNETISLNILMERLQNHERLQQYLCDEIQNKLKIN